MYFCVHSFKYSDADQTCQLGELQSETDSTEAFETGYMAVANAATSTTTSSSVATPSLVATPSFPANIGPTPPSGINVNPAWKLPDGLELNKEYNLADLKNLSPFDLPYWGPGFKIHLAITIKSLPDSE